MGVLLSAERGEGEADDDCGLEGEVAGEFVVSSQAIDETYSPRANWKNESLTRPALYRNEGFLLWIWESVVSVIASARTAELSDESPISSNLKTDADFEDFGDLTSGDVSFADGLGDFGAIGDDIAELVSFETFCSFLLVSALEIKTS